MAKELIKKLGEFAELYRDTENGIAWVEDGSTGMGHGAHPNIDKSGSVKGMKNRGYWGRGDRTVQSHGFIHNVDVFCAHDLLDYVASESCECVGCQSRRRTSPTIDHNRRREQIEEIAMALLTGKIDKAKAAERFRQWQDGENA